MEIGGGRGTWNRPGFSSLSPELTEIKHINFGGVLKALSVITFGNVCENEGVFETFNYIWDVSLA